MNAQSMGGSTGAQRGVGRALAALLLATTVTGCGLFAKPPEVAPPPEPEVQLHLKLAERRLYLKQDNRDGTEPLTLESYPVAIGRKQYPTPTGRFAVFEKVVDPDWVQFDWKNPSKTLGRIPPGPNNPMGKRWVGFAMAHGWGIGFHGTPKPQALGQAVSHGCVRMHNDDIVRMFDRIAIGTPVIVEE